MGVFSWFGSLLSRAFSGGPAGDPGGSHTLVRDSGRDSRTSEEIKRAAAADVARVEEDDKYFGPDSPGNQDDDL
jgi:hypothetical protein